MQDLDLLLCKTTLNSPFGCEFSLHCLDLYIVEKGYLPRVFAPRKGSSIRLQHLFQVEKA
jgi:hypothetical protein